MVKTAVGIRIRDQREALKLSQEELAKACGVHKMTISKWERNESSPEKKIVALSSALGKSPDWLLTGKDDSIKLRLTARQQKVLNDTTDQAGRLRWQYYFKLDEALKGIKRVVSDLKKDVDQENSVRQIESYSEIIGTCLSEITNLDPINIEQDIAINEELFILRLAETQRCFLEIQRSLNRLKAKQ